MDINDAGRYVDNITRSLEADYSQMQKDESDYDVACYREGLFSSAAVSKACDLAIDFFKACGAELMGLGMCMVIGGHDIYKMCANGVSLSFQGWAKHAWTNFTHPVNSPLLDGLWSQDRRFSHKLDRMNKASVL